MAFLKHSITELTLTARRNSSRYVGLLESLKRPRHGWPCARFSCSVQRLCCTLPLLHSSSPADRNRPAVYREPAKRFDEAPRSKVTLLISIWMNPPYWRVSHGLFFLLQFNSFLTLSGPLRDRYLSMKTGFVLCVCSVYTSMIRHHGL